MSTLSEKSENRTAVAVQLNYADGDLQVCVTPKNQDRFAIKIELAIEFLKEGIVRERFPKQLNLLMNQLSSWIISRDKEISRAYLTMRDESLCFLVERRVATYDESFEDALSDLDIQISDDSDLEGIRFCSMALPPISDDALESFLHPKFQIRFDR